VNRIDFKKEAGATPFHDTSTTFIGTTTNGERALHMLVGSVNLIKINHDKWPKETRSLKNRIRFILKETGCRNFLVVLTEGGM